MYDIIIVGGGAAGLSAAITAKARNKNALLIGNSVKTSSIYKAERIDNYLGFYNVDGKEMLKRFSEHADEMGVSIIEGKVLQILSMGDYFSLNAGDDFYESKTVILAPGIKRGGKIKGEGGFVGKGVSYCATCDGMLYRGKKVALIGENEEAEADIKFLSEICSEVFVIQKNEPESGYGDKVTLITGEVREIFGENKAEGVVVNGERIICDGVFIIGDSIPSESLIYGLETQDGAIVTNKKMCTSIDGVFAAGDCTGSPYQISKAVGEGLIAALSAVQYLSKSVKQAEAER